MTRVYVNGVKELENGVTIYASALDACIDKTLRSILNELGYNQIMLAAKSNLPFSGFKQVCNLVAYISFDPVLRFSIGLYNFPTMDIALDFYNEQLLKGWDAKDLNSFLSYAKKAIEYNGEPCDIEIKKLT